MFKTKLQKATGKINGFIAELKAGLDANSQDISALGTQIATLETTQEGLYQEQIAGNNLLANLSKLTEGK